MNKLITISFFLLLMFGLISNSKSQTFSETQSELIKNQINSIFQGMVATAEKLDFDKLSLGVDDSHGAGFISNGKYYSNYSTLISDVKENARGLSHQNISIKEQKITVLSDNVVLLTASGVSSASINDGREIVVGFHWSFVFEKIDKEWKVIYSHQSLVN